MNRRLDSATDAKQLKLIGLRGTDTWDCAMETYRGGWVRAAGGGTLVEVIVIVSSFLFDVRMKYASLMIYAPFLYIGIILLFHDMHTSSRLS